MCGRGCESRRRPSRSDGSQVTRAVRWPPSEILLLERALDELSDAVRDRPGARTDDEQMWLTRFLVVRSCGYLEQVMYLCATNHLEAKSAGTARSYSLSWLERSINPSVSNISVTLGRFDQGLADEFELMLSENNGELQNDLSALVTKRHAIAHGKNEGLGATRALALCEVAKQMADWMIRSFCPDPSWSSSFSR